MGYEEFDNDGAVQEDKTVTQKTDYVVLSLFTILGIGLLLPWNCFINSYGFWMEKFASNVTEYEGRTDDSGYVFTTYQDFWTSSLAVTTMTIGFTFTLVNMLVSSKLSTDIRVYPSYILMLSSFLAIAVLTQIDTTSWTSAFFVLSLVIVVFCQIAMGFLNALFGLVGNLPGQYINAFMQGQAVGGIFAAVLEIISMLSFKKDIIDMDGNPETIVDQYAAGLMFFITAAVMMAINLVGYWYCKRTDLVVHTLQANAKAPGEEIQAVTISKIFNDIVTVGRLVTYQAASVHINFWITIAVFPAVQQLAISSCPNSSTSWYCENLAGEFFVPVFCFLLFNVGDWVGRYLAGPVKVLKKEQGLILLICTLSRIVVAVCFLFIKTESYSGAGFLGEDWAYITLMVLFSVSNGYFVALGIEFGPQLVQPEEKELAASILPCFMQLGLLFGAVTSFATVAIMPSN